MARTRISFLTKPALFLLAGLCITVATTGVVAVALYQMRLDAMAQARDMAENLAISLEKETERTLDIYQIAMRNVLTNLETPSPELAPETRQLLAFNAAGTISDLGVIIATDTSGKVVLDSRSMQPSTIDVSRRDYFLVHQQSPDVGLYFSKPFMPITKSDYHSIAMSRRLADANGRFEGVVAGTLSLRYFRHLFEDSILGDHGSLTLIRTRTKPGSLGHSSISLTWPDGTPANDTSDPFASPATDCLKKMSYSSCSPLFSPASQTIASAIAASSARVIAPTQT